jgi:hypothetical protein
VDEREYRELAKFMREASEHAARMMRAFRELLVAKELPNRP